MASNLGGGLVGAAGYSVTYPLLANVGTILIALILMVASIYITFDLPFHKTMQALRQALMQLGQQLRSGYEWLTHVLRVQIARWRVHQQVRANQAASTEKQPTSTVPQSAAPAETTSGTSAPDSAASAVTSSPADLNITVASDREASPIKSPTSAATVDHEQELQGTEVMDDADYQLPESTLLTKIPKRIRVLSTQRLRVTRRS